MESPASPSRGSSASGLSSCASEDVLAASFEAPSPASVWEPTSDASAKESATASCASALETASPPAEPSLAAELSVTPLAASSEPHAMDHIIDVKQHRMTQPLRLPA